MSQCSMPPAWACSSAIGRADDLEIGGVDEHRDAAAVGDAPQRAADGVEDALGLDLERAGEDLGGERERERDGVALGLLGDLLAQLLAPR